MNKSLTSINVVDLYSCSVMRHIPTFELFNSKQFIVLREAIIHNRFFFNN